MSTSPTRFSATGTIESFVVPAAGNYVIEAAGAQGGAGGGPGGKGARVRGTFFLNEGDVLKIVVGQQGGTGNTPHLPAGGGGGGSFVWKGAAPWPLPPKPLLAAGGGGGGCGSDGVITLDAGTGAAAGGRNGHGGEADGGDFRYSGGGGAGWRSNGADGSTPTRCGGGTQWSGGAGASYCCNLGGNGGFGGGGGGAFIGRGSGGGGGFSGGGGGTQIGPGGGGGGSFNAGASQQNTPGIQEGDGSVTLFPVATAGVFLMTGRFQANSASPFPDTDTASADERQSVANGLEGKGYF